MGYTKIVQFGNVTEIYDYEKPLPERIKDLRAVAYNLPKKIPTDLERKRLADRKAEKKRKDDISLRINGKVEIQERSKRSIYRTKLNFFRLTHHNNVNSNSVNFLTITFIEDHSLKDASRHVAKFYERFKANYPEVPLRYISVPELTKKGRYHFHCLVYDLPPEISKRERKTRNLQRLFRQGYIDLGDTAYTSEGLAGYLAKYMAKAIRDHKNEAIRGYSCSRNIKKIYVAGDNSLSKYTDLVVDPVDFKKDVEYETIFLGKCKKSTYKKTINKNKK